MSTRCVVSRQPVDVGVGLARCNGDKSVVSLCVDMQTVSVKVSGVGPVHEVVLQSAGLSAELVCNSQTESITRFDLTHTRKRKEERKEGRKGEGKKKRKTEKRRKEEERRRKRRKGNGADIM